MKIYHDIKRIGWHDTIDILQQALTFAYDDSLLRAKVEIVFDRIVVTYMKSDIKIGIEITMYELEFKKITLEQFALDIKNRVISQYRYEMDRLYNGGRR
ncbi:MAG: hypothetical protein E6305_04105 [Veillonella sp.]|jgi:hypothetical protein|nr:hypothetical protein [Veillonella sp.]DAS56264.1 MAG TPA: hypothetical protein [Caudoviricetes sp.]